MSDNSTKELISIYKYPWTHIITGIFIAFICTVVAVAIGSVYIPVTSVITIIFSKLDVFQQQEQITSSWHTIIWNIRFPRVVLALLVGASLGISGATYQGLFKNPLADPYLIGVASGASLGATIVFLTGVPFTYGYFSFLPLASFCGGLAAVCLAYLISIKSGDTQLSTLLLAGIAIGAFATAITGILMLSSDPDLRPLLSWLMGGFIRAQWSHSILIIPYMTIGIIFILGYSRVLNTMQLEEYYSESLGVDVEKAKRVLIISATLMTAVAVSFSGLIGFVGLVAPHVVRLLWGTDYRTILPLSGIAGATFLVIADLTARTVVSPIELPVGIITALVGSPFFVYLLLKAKRRMGNGY
jgi:iron complex transport system permease protein